ncbi:MAG: hypothetical protein NTY77_06995 [Elusimicrobia bacterium]|nr:hypothetical protein [Elusimicrobiota bacterium]
MNAAMSNGTDKALDFGPGIVEVRRITSRYFGVRVQRRLIPRLKNVKGLTRANSKSDLFCVEVDGMNNNPESAHRRFREIVAGAGLGMHFGVDPSQRPGT